MIRMNRIRNEKVLIMTDRQFKEIITEYKTALKAYPYKSDMEEFDGEPVVRSSMARTNNLPQPVRIASVMEDIFKVMPARVKPYDLFVGQKGGPGCHCLESEALARGSAEFPYNIPDYAMLMEKGADSMIDDINTRLEMLDEAVPEHMERVWFLTSVKIVLKALIDLAKRYSDEAGRQAGSCADPVRKAQLLEIQSRCLRIPAKPAESFADAIQAMWFIYSAAQTESSSACCVGQIDRYLYPYYKADMDSGAMDRNTAKLYLCHLWGKVYEKNYGTAADQMQTCSIGGTKADGASAVNELSWLAMETAYEMGNVGLQIAIRWSGAVEKDFVKAAIRLMKDNRIMPQLFNDDIYIPGIVKFGVSREDAVKYALFGCHEPVIAGLGYMRPSSYPGYLNAYSWVESALSVKTLRKPNLHIEKTGDYPKTKDEFMARFFNAMREAVRNAVIAMNYGDKVKRELMPRPFMSAFMHDCIENESDITAGGARYNMTGFQVCGFANAVDALLAVSALVFDDRMISMDDYIGAMEVNFEGKEDIRQMILKKAPKYGTDSDEADTLAAHIANEFCDETEKYTNERGGRFTPGFWSFITSISMGQRTGPGADGRLGGTHMSHDLDPYPGRAVKGATAVANTLTRLPQYRMVNGACTLIEFDSTTLKDDESFDKLYGYFNTYMEKGGLNVQMSHVSLEKLKAALKDPSEHEDLVVRVSGYSDFFTNCSPETQKFIYEREKHRF